MNIKKIKNSILYLLNKSIKPLDLDSLMKLIYYTDTYFFQKYQKTLYNTNYIHIGKGPYPVKFYEIIHKMIKNEQIQARPKIIENKEKMGGYYFIAKKKPNENHFSKNELHSLRAVSYSFRNGIEKETNIFPNLYQNYILTDVFQKINLLKRKIPKKIKIRKKPRYIKQKSFLYRIFFK
jgi:hypothetical protein